MNDLDMNIDNYELDDLLNLFNLEFDFIENDLKQAKKIVLMTHPDKSNLAKEYFLFFTSAYKIILSIYEFRHRATKNKVSSSLKYIPDEKDEEKELLLKKIKDKPNFNKLFNELFEKNKVNYDDTDNGYGDWLVSEEDIDTRKTTLGNMNATFEKKKKEVRAIVKQTEIDDIGGGNNNGDLTRDKPEYYSSSVFSNNLEYQDLKRAHVESVVPVTQEDYLNRPKFQNVDELRKYNSSQNTTPLSEKQSQEYFQSQSKKQSQIDVQRAFKLARQDEQTRKANMGWMSGFKQLM